MSYEKFPHWVECPACGSDDVAVWADPDREVGFECQDCGEGDGPRLWLYEDE